MARFNINDLITDPLEIDRLRPKLIGISGADSSFLSIIPYNHKRPTEITVVWFCIYKSRIEFEKEE